MRSERMTQILKNIPEEVTETVKDYAENISRLNSKFKFLIEEKGILPNHLAYMAKQQGLGDLKVEEIMKNGILGIQPEDEDFFINAIEKFNLHSDSGKSIADIEG